MTAGMSRRNRFPLTSGADGFVFPSSLGNARANFDIVHEMIGGNDRMADWADKNPGDFYKLYSKTIVKEIDQRTEITESLEQKIARLEAQANAGDRAINVTPVSIDGVPYAREPAPAASGSWSEDDEQEDRD